jgi:hypothetical protein
MARGIGRQPTVGLYRERLPSVGTGGSGCLDGYALEDVVQRNQPNANENEPPPLCRRGECRMLRQMDEAPTNSKI